MEKFSLIVLLGVGIVFSSCSRGFYSYSAQKQQQSFSLDLGQYKSPQLRPGQDPNLVLGMAISGGGSRAACFALGVMMGLEELRYNDSSDILNEIDYFSTVSGGGFAGGYYMTQKAHHESCYRSERFSLNKIWKTENKHQHNLPVIDLNSNVFKNIFIHNSFSPGRRMNQILDSIKTSIVLEGKPDCNKNIYQKILLEDVFVDTASSRPVILPVHIANASFYTNNNRMPMVPYIIDDLNITGLFYPKTKFNGRLMPLYYGITASASFPGVLLQMRFQSSDSSLIRVYDGGVSDNFGYKSMVDIFRKMPNRENHRLIVIDASGQGLPAPETGIGSVGIFKIFTKMIFAGLQSKYTTSKDEVKDFFKNDSSFCFIGINSIRKFAEDNYYLVPAKLQTKKKLIWSELYDYFITVLEQPITAETGVGVIDSPEKYWLLFELAAQVKTKLYINPEEKNLLVLAGRVAVKIHEAELKKLMTSRRR